MYSNSLSTEQFTVTGCPRTHSLVHSYATRMLTFLHRASKCCTSRPCVKSCKNIDLPRYNVPSTQVSTKNQDIREVIQSQLLDAGRRGAGGASIHSAHSLVVGVPSGICMMRLRRTQDCEHTVVGYPCIAKLARSAHDASVARCGPTHSLAA
jgi:hypothetical protein